MVKAHESWPFPEHVAWSSLYLNGAIILPDPSFYGHSAYMNHVYMIPTKYSSSCVLLDEVTTTANMASSVIPARECPSNFILMLFFTEMYLFCPFLGRFSFQPLQQNSLLGPAYYLLIKMGALHVDKLVHIHQAWRLFTSIWLHRGLIDLLFNMIFLVMIGIPLEKKFGFVRIGLVYVISGLGGNLLCVLFLQSIIYAGASGAILGLLGGMVSKLLTNWRKHTQFRFKMLILFLIITIYLVIGTLSFGDNFSHIGGFTSGFLLGFVILIRPHYNGLNRTKSNSPPKQKPYQHALLIISFVLLTVGLVSGLVLFLKGVDLNDYCSWCHYLTCAPPSCKREYISCLSDYPIGNKLNVTCLNNGRSGLFPLSNRNPDEQTEELCYRLCGK